MYKKIVVCIDETPLSERVTRTAADLAQRYDVGVVLLSVVDPSRIADPPYSGLEAVQMVERHSRTLTNSVNNMSALLSNMGVDSRQFVVPGRSVETILRTAESESADLIVIGTEARGRLHAWLTNDLWSELSHKAPCNVLRVTANDSLPDSRSRTRNPARRSLLTTSISAL